MNPTICWGKLLVLCLELLLLTTYPDTSTLLETQGGDVWGIGGMWAVVVEDYTDTRRKAEAVFLST